MTDPRDAFFDVSDLGADLGARTGRGARAVLGFAIIKLVVALLTVAVLARLIPPAEHGLLALAMPLVLIATGLSEFGLAQAITQMPHVTHRLASTLFWTNVGLGLVLTTIVAALGSVAATFYAQPAVAAVFWVLAPYVFLTVLNTQYMALLRRRLRVQVIEVAVLSATLLSAIVAIALAFAGYGITALVVQLLLMQALTWVFLARATGWRPSVPWEADFAQARGALRFGGYLAGERLLNDLGRTVQIGMIGRVFGDVAAGLYYRAETFALMPQRRVVSPLSAAFIPALSRLQDDAVGFAAMFTRQISRGNLIMVPVGAYLCVAPDLVVAVLLGPDWAAAEPLLAWLGVLVMSALTASILAWALVATGQGRALFLYRIVSTGIIVVAVVSGASFGLVPLVACYVIAVAVVNVALLAIVVQARTHIAANVLAQTLFSGLVMAVGLAGAGFAVRFALQAPVAVEGVAAGVAICVVTAVFVGFKPDLRRDVMRLFAR